MLRLLILLHILCFVPDDAFPQRTKPHDQSNFDFDAYLEHFTPTKQTVLSHQSFSNQDYRYIPLLGEQPDYIPPVIHRGHFLHPNIPKRVVKHRSWHSTYQNSNFPTPAFEQPAKHVANQKPIQSHGEMRQLAPEFSVPTGNFNFRIHSKMEDFGDYEAPVVVEGIKKEPVFHQQNEDYDIPEVLEAIVKKHTIDSLKRKDHENVLVVPPKQIATYKNYAADSPNFMEPSDEEYEAPVVIESLLKVENPKLNKDHQKMETSHSYFSEDYEEPVVLEALTKVHKKSGKNKHVTIHPAMKPTVKPVDKHVSSYQEVHEAPTAFNAFTKEGLANSKGHDMKKPVKGTPMYLEELAHSQEKIVHRVKEKPLEEKDLKNPIVKTVVSVYSEDYEAPEVVTAFKKELAYTKGRVAHQVKKQSSEKNWINPIVKKTPDYFEDYEAPVVMEAFTKDELPDHTKEISNKITSKGKPVAKQDKVKLDYSEDKPGVLKALTNEELFHKENVNKQTVKKHENTQKSKHDHKQAESTEDYKTEYDYKELENYLINEDGDYENLVDTINEMHHDLDEYSYEDLPEESLVPGVHHSGMKHSLKSTIIKTPVKTLPEDKEDKISKISDVKEYDYKADKEISQSQKRVKREVTVDYEFLDELEALVKHTTKHEIKPSEEVKSTEFEQHYEAPAIVETIKKEKFIPKHTNSKPNPEVALVHKPNFVEPSPDEDYESPVIVETISKGVFTSDKAGENKFVTKHTHSKPNSGILIGNKPSNIVEPSLGEDYEYPVIVETISKVAGPYDGKTGKIPSKVHAHSKPNPEVLNSQKPVFVEQSLNDYELPKIVETISKVPTNKKPGKISSKIKPQIKDYESSIVIEAINKADGSTGDHRHIVKSEVKDHFPVEDVLTKENPDTYIRSKREHEYNMEYQYPVDSASRDAYERPVDEYEWHDYLRPGNYFEEREPVHQENTFHRNFESFDLPDNQKVLDSITINRESPDGHDIPFLDVLAVDNQVDGGHENGVKVMAFNKENGAVEVINVGHEDSNHDIESLAEPGSGDVDERSLDSRSFLPLNSNPWSFMTRVQSQERRKFRRCLTPRNETGNCMPIQMCSVSNIGNTVEELLKNVCIIDEVFIGICCPEFPVETVHVDWGQFGKPDTEPLLEKVDESPKITECGKLPSTFGDKDSWPWMTPLISTTSDKVFCGGALISESYVLTAAHCTSKIPRNQIMVRLRNLDSQESSSAFAVIEIKRHAQYNPRTMQNDIALLKLSRKVPLGHFRKLVCLPNDDVEDYVGETPVLLRWQGIAEKGAVESLSVIANQDCQNRLGALVGGSVLCTETRNDDAMCNADSGAPLVIEKDGVFQIIGTLTWNRNDCDANFPTVFTRISSYLKWIQTHTK